MMKLSFIALMAIYTICQQLPKPSSQMLVISDIPQQYSITNLVNPKAAPPPAPRPVIQKRSIPTPPPSFRVDQPMQNRPTPPPASTNIKKQESNNKNNENEPNVQFQDFSQIQFKADRKYDNKNMDHRSVIDSNGNVASLDLTSTVTSLEKASSTLSFIPKTINDAIDKIKDVGKDVTKAIQGYIKPTPNPIQKQTKVQTTKTTQQIPRKKLRTDKNLPQNQNSIIKYIFTVIVGASLIIILLSYKPEERDKGPYIPAQQEQSSIFK